MNHQTTINFDTRKEALEKVRPGKKLTLASILTVLECYGDHTADEMAHHLDYSILYIRPRFSELNKAGEIIDTGLRRANKSGKKAIVWALNSK